MLAGRTGTHHVTYELDLIDGGVLRTRISHPVDRSSYGRSMWSTSSVISLRSMNRSSGRV
jgi:hypothetical protein